MSKDDVFYKAMLARDYRFDGKFFVGVKTTGIYCRPICPAKPKRKNVKFFSTATAAEKDGYRPCLRCRPESAPLSPAWIGTSALVTRALRAISQDGFISENEDAFAEQFGVSARHLRRLFTEEVGLTPKQIAFNNRLNFARKLVVESPLSISSVALSAGFSSLRRFNDAFKKRFHRSPSQVRKKNVTKTADGIYISLSYRPPFQWNALLDFFRNHQIIGTEIITNNSYERVFKIGKAAGFFRVADDTDNACLKLYIHVDDPTALFVVSQKVRQMFDLDSDPLLVANCMQTDAFTEKTYRKIPGLRIACAWDPFESTVCTILGQLVSLKQARALVSQLVQNYGESFIHPETQAASFLFPTPEALINCDLSKVRTTTARKNAIRVLAGLVVSGELNLTLPLPAPALKEKLLAIPGVGDWTAEYISLRAFGNTDAFPKTDLILKRALAKHPHLNLEDFQPWRSYLAIYLWNLYAGSLSKAKGTKNESVL